MRCRHHFSSCLAVESLSWEQQGQRCCSSASLWAGTAVPARGKSPLHCPQVQWICSGMESQKHLSKRRCFIMSAGAPEPDLGTVDPVAPSSGCSEYNFSPRDGRNIPWAAARMCSWGDGSVQGYRYPVLLQDPATGLMFSACVGRY